MKSSIRRQAYRRPFRLLGQIEALEPRRMMAADIDFSNGFLELVGDNQDDEVLFVGYRDFQPGGRLDAVIFKFINGHQTDSNDPIFINWVEQQGLVTLDREPNPKRRRPRSQMPQPGSRYSSVAGKELAAEPIRA